MAGLGVAAVLGTALLLDRKVDDAAVRNSTPSRLRLAKDVAQVGGTGGLLLMGAGYVGFSLLGQDGPRSVVVDMGMATVLAQVAILPLKYGLGRSRPSDEQGAGHFRPLTSSDSFPSGHTTQAFAMAAALSMDSSRPWVGWCAYSAAGLVGLSRLATRDHHASDVVAGALVGTVMGRTVAGFNRGLRARSGRAQFSLTPALGPGYQGLTFQARF
jgi:membrane-associated phospholipid phosphatase